MDPGTGVGALAAVAAGLVSFLSPCLLLVPGYLAAVVGVVTNELEDARTRRVLPASLLFVASVSAVFIALGVSATAVGAILSVAALSQSAGHGALLPAFYSAGLAIRFLATALAFGRMTAVLAGVRRHFRSS